MEFTERRERSILVPTTYCMSHCGLIICANICLQEKKVFSQPASQAFLVRPIVFLEHFPVIMIQPDSIIL